MTASNPRPDFQSFTQAVIENHRANGGQITTGPFKGRQILLLHTLGAKSGEPRIAPLAFSRDGDRYVVMASKGGAPTNPSWLANLLANPEVTVEADGDTFRALADVYSDGPERQRLWDAHAALHPGFKEYSPKTSRVIPAVVLERLP